MHRYEFSSLALKKRNGQKHRTLAVVVRSQMR